MLDSGIRIGISSRETAPFNAREKKNKGGLTELLRNPINELELPRVKYKNIWERRELC
jgi:hypothetical protein